MSNPKKSPSLLMESLIKDIKPASRRKKVQRAIDEHFEDSTQLDGRGRRTSELENTCKALRHLRNMPNWQTDERFDLNMRRRIRDIIKHVEHGQPWFKTIEECMQARGLVNKSARKRNERTEYGDGTPRQLDGDFVCFPLNSATKLRSAGKRGQNCLGSRHYDHAAELKSGTAEYYEIRAACGRPSAFLRIDTVLRTVTNIEGPDPSGVELPDRTLWSICQELNANGDECSEFVRLGVLSLVRESLAKGISPMSRIHDFQLWWRNAEIVLKDTKTGNWSRFVWWTEYRTGCPPEWMQSDGSEIDTRAFDLMLRCQPRLSAIAEKARVSDNHAPRRDPGHLHIHRRRGMMDDWL